MADTIEPHNSKLNDDSRYRLLVDAITDYAIFMLTPEGIVASWNAGAQRFKGYAASEIIGKHFSQFYTEEDRRNGEPARALATAAREGRFEKEGWRLRKDGTRIWVHVVIDPIRDPAGALIGYAKITRDLTHRKRTEESLRRSQEQFRLLVQGVTDYAIYMLDPLGHVTSWNLGAQRIKGYAPEEIIGAHFSRFYTEEDRCNGDPERALATAAREGRFEKEGWRLRKDGTRFRAHVIIDPVRDPKGVLLGFAKITRDITEREEAQRALNLAREILFQSQKMEAIGQMTGGVAHDINNVLMAVISSLELMRKRLPDDPRIMSLLENAVQGAQRGASVTQRMLAFARRQELKPEPVDLPGLVRGMAELLQRSLGPSVAIGTRFPLKLDRVLADINQIEMALLNLAVNARDAMPEGGPLTISARTEVVDRDGSEGLKPGRYVCLSVEDKGEGMDEETLTRATEPFFTTKGVGKGTGLGLSMVHGVAQQLGGALILKSKKGQGTTVEIWLPAIEEGARVAGVTPAAAQTMPDVPPLTILAVDDDPLVLMNTAMMLEELGHRVLSAESGEQALTILRRETAIDLVISDQAMPRLTGAQLAETIRAERPGLPIILATGYAELPSGTEVSLPRLAKPFSEADLVRIIAKTMNPRPRAATA